MADCFKMTYIANSREEAQMSTKKQVIIVLFSLCSEICLPVLLYF